MKKINLSKILNYLLNTKIGRNYLIRKVMKDFTEKLIAISNFQLYIQDQCSFTLEKKIYVDANNQHIENLKEEINNFLTNYILKLNENE